MIHPKFEAALAIRPTVEVFEITASSEAQKADHGWYFFMVLPGVEMGEPLGPYDSEDAARREADGLFRH